MNMTSVTEANHVITWILFCLTWVNSVTSRQWMPYRSMSSIIFRDYQRKNANETWTVSKLISSLVSRLNLYPISYKNICINKKNNIVVTQTPSINADTNYSLVELTFNDELMLLNVFSRLLLYRNLFMNPHNPRLIILISSASVNPEFL